MKEETKEILRKAGYYNLTEIGKALADAGVYSSGMSASGLLGRVLNGGRKAPSRLTEGLTKLIGKEEVGKIFQIEGVRTDRRLWGRHKLPQLERTNLGNGLELRLDEDYTILKHYFLEADPIEKMRMCVDFRGYVDRYIKLDKE